MTTSFGAGQKSDSGADGRHPSDECERTLVAPPTFDQDLCLLQCLKDLAAEQFVAPVMGYPHD